VATLTPRPATLKLFADPVLPPGRRLEPRLNKNELVASTEATADSEISAWKKTLKVKNLKAGSPTGAEEAVEVDD